MKEYYYLTEKNRIQYIRLCKMEELKEGIKSVVRCGEKFIAAYEVIKENGKQEVKKLCITD